MTAIEASTPTTRWKLWFCKSRMHPMLFLKQRNRRQMCSKRARKSVQLQWNVEIPANGRKWKMHRWWPRRLPFKWMSVCAARLCYRTFWNWTNTRPHMQRSIAKCAISRFCGTRIWSGISLRRTANQSHSFAICADWDSRFRSICKHMRRSTTPGKFKWKMRINSNQLLPFRITKCFVRNEITYDLI